MDLRHIAAATMTLVRSDDEEQLLRRSLRLLADTGIEMAIADAGTSAAFVDFLGRLPGAVIVREQSGLVGQVRAAVETATRFKRPFILYTEPDKEAFFARHLGRFIQQIDEAGDLGVVLAARSPASFDTFPPMQRYVESIVNHLCEDATGIRGDYSYGPFVMGGAAARAVMTAKLQLGWGWRPYLFAATRRAGLSVAHIEGDFECPHDQRGEDAADKAHRLRQLCQNITGLLA